MSRAIQQINRRVLIRAGIATLPAISAGTLPAVGASASASPVTELDPIFAAIEARKQAEARSYGACSRLGAFEEGQRGPAGELPSVEDHPELDALEAANDGGRDEGCRRHPCNVRDRTGDASWRGRAAPLRLWMRGRWRQHPADLYGRGR